LRLYNWTSLGLRDDAAGSGRFGSPRGSRKHQGYDRLCVPGQIIKSPLSGKMVRSYPYAKDMSYKGCSIWSDEFMIKMWYFEPYEDLIHSVVEAGQDIGIAQDISAKYGGEMKPHVHLGLWGLYPTVLLNPELYFADNDKLKNSGGY